MMRTILGPHIPPATLLIDTMLTAILIVNLLLAGFCFWIAWQMWRWRDALANAADALWEADRATHELLNEAPESITFGQINTRQLRHSYRQLEGQLQQLQKVLGLVSLSRQLMLSQRRALPLLRLTKTVR